MIRTGRGRAILRTVGMGLLGVVGGLLLAVIVQDVLARLLDGPGPSGLATVAVGAVMPICILGGVVLALWVDRRRDPR